MACHDHISLQEVVVAGLLVIFALFYFQAELEAQLQETRQEVAALTAEGKRIQVTQ